MQRFHFETSRFGPRRIFDWNRERSIDQCDQKLGRLFLSSFIWGYVAIVKLPFNNSYVGELNCIQANINATYYQLSSSASYVIFRMDFYTIQYESWLLFTTITNIRESREKKLKSYTYPWLDKGRSSQQLNSQKACLFIR